MKVTCRQDQTAIRGACKFRDILLDLPGITDADRTHFHSNRWRHVLDYSELADSQREPGIPKNRHPRDGWGNLVALRPGLAKLSM